MDTQTQIVISFVTVLLSGVLAALVSQQLTNKNEIRQIKYRIFSDLLGNRAALTEEGTPSQIEIFYSTLNRIFLIFDGNEKVINALRRFSTNPGRDSDTFQALVKEICSDLSLKTVKDNDDLILNPFIPRRKN